MERTLTWRVLVKLVKKHLYFNRQSPPFELRIDEDANVAYFDIELQVQLLLSRYMEEIHDYRRELRLGNGDVLCGCDSIELNETLNLHLHLSTDGGQLHTYRKQTIWPVHCTLLDLPLKLRCKRENMIIFALWESRRKPDWSTFLSHYLSDTIIGKTKGFYVNGEFMKVHLRLHSAVFDLPAMASILNHIQFNGKFGCLYCCAPGSMVKSGRGHSRKYGGIVDQISDADFSEYSDLAASHNETIFGIKGKSIISNFICIPSHVLLDPLHLLFENCSKLMMFKLIDSSSFRETYFLGRHINSYDRIFSHFRFPPFVSRPRTLRDARFWKGRDMMDFTFFYSIPTIFSSLYYKFNEDKEHSFHFFVFVIACRMCYCKSAREKSGDIKELFDYFHSRLTYIYDMSMCTINMHLLLHLGDQIAKFGALPYISMFTFEHQFQTFKLLAHGTTSFLKQICEKITLLKHCTCHLDVCNYTEKKKLLNFLKTNRTSGVRFIDKGHVSRNGSYLYAQSYSRIGKLSSVYTVVRGDESLFVDLVEFSLSSNGGIKVKANVLEKVDAPIFSFLCHELSSVPRYIVDIMNRQDFYYIVRRTENFNEFFLTEIDKPCVVMNDFEHCILVMPCHELMEYH